MVCEMHCRWGSRCEFGNSDWSAATLAFLASHSSQILKIFVNKYCVFIYNFQYYFNYVIKVLGFRFNISLSEIYTHTHTQSMVTFVTLLASSRFPALSHSLHFTNLSSLLWSRILHSHWFFQQSPQTLVQLLQSWWFALAFDAQQVTHQTWFSFMFYEKPCMVCQTVCW